MQLTESICLLSDPLAIGVAVLEEIAVAADFKEQYPVWIGRCLIIFYSLCCLFVIMGLPMVVTFECLLPFVEWYEALAAGRVVRSSLFLPFK